ncbi:MFS transporter [Prolixibacter sp. NT017]|uniref:MFS transporter n=1 Tax=Prolixibacter sp. NT017 TaxID=2652390 RepID=UPI001298F02E|nr:MFS transporter [Prolixibacter sp. NT017]
MKALQVFKKFPRTFWVANTMELFERWAWYGFFSLFALYLTGSTDEGGMGFTQIQKGNIMGIGTAILYFLPIITGTISDRIGYKRTLYIAYTVYTTAFIAMPFFHTYFSVFFIFLYLALGAALFKPIVSATVAKTTDETTSSIGFGLFYMMVNIGAFIGPFVTNHYQQIAWKYVYFSSAAVIAANFILLTFFYREPTEKQKQKESSLGKNIIEVFKNIGVALSDVRFVVFLIIVSGFWTMYNQLFFSLPVFIEQWANTSIVYDMFHSWWPWLAEQIGTSNGTIPPNILINADAGFIILFQIIVSSIAMKFRPLNAMITGMLIASIGVGFSMATQNGIYTLIAILIFSLGEMSSSPKITEYIGRIAPADKTALYMGCSFLPVAAGNYFAGIISGNVYQSMSDKIQLAKNEMASRGIHMPEISKAFSQNDYLKTAADKLHMNLDQFTNFLWDKYHPSNIWVVVTGIGVGAAVLLFLYDRLLLKKK